MRWPWGRRPVASEQVARIAAAQAVTAEFSRVQPRTRQAWQDRARFFADNLGLIRFANGLTAQTGARCELRPEVLVNAARDEWEPDDDPVTSEIIHSYRGRDADTPAELVGRQIWHYKTVGECYQVVDEVNGALSWSIRSARNLQFRAAGVLVSDLPGGSLRDGTARLLPPEAVRRLWVPDEEWPAWAISPMKGILNDCERYWALARRIRREAESALTNGLLFTPGYAHTPIRPANPLHPGENPGTQQDRDYYRIAEKAFTDDDSVEAVAPWSWHYDSPSMDRDPLAPQFIYPGKMLDKGSLEFRMEAVECMGRGLDLPQSLVVHGAGGSDQNHWSAWLVKEDFFTSHIAPTMDRVTHSDLTESFFRPVLRELVRLGRWNGSPKTRRLGYDPTPVLVHPDRAAAAITMYGLGLLKAAVVLETNGFNKGDAPDVAELAQILEALRAIHGRQAEQITLSTAPASNVVDQGITGLGSQDGGGVGPSTTSELPPAPALAAVGAAIRPYPAEVGSWLDD